MDRVEGGVWLAVAAVFAVGACGCATRPVKIKTSAVPGDYAMPSNLVHWAAPEGEPASSHYALEIDGTPVFVHAARVRTEILKNDGLWTHRPDAAGEPAAFAIFDVRGPVQVVVRPRRPFKTAVVLPERAAITPRIEGNTIRFTLEKARHLTIALDDSDKSPLHLFISDPEPAAPRADDPNVVYFAPGIHDIETLAIKSGQTVYLAGGAVVRARLAPGEQGKYSDKWKVTFFGGRVLNLDGVSDVTIRGRGILDGSLVPHPGRNMIGLNNCRRIRVEGITLRDSPNWNMIIQRSSDISVDNVRIVSGRLNSDGINSVNSRQVQIRRCFVRNHDDSIVAKTTAPDVPCEDITVEDCTIWADWGYALGATYETRSPIRSLSFRRCDILFAHHWCMGIHVSDSATVSGIHFADIGISRLVRPPTPDSPYRCLSAAPKLVSMRIVSDVWGHDPERGHIRDVSFDGVTIHTTEMPASEIRGLDAGHAVENVAFRNVRQAGQRPVQDAAGLGLTTNEWVRNLRIDGP